MMLAHLIPMWPIYLAATVIIVGVALLLVIASRHDD